MAKYILSWAMGNFFHNKLDVVLWSSAAVLTVVLAVVIFFAVRSAFRVVNAVRDTDLIQDQETVMFNLAKVKELRQR